LADGRTFSASTTSSAAFEDVRKFAATAGLRPGTVRILGRFGRNWTNGATAFTVKNCAGTYEYVDERGGGRRMLEMWLQNGRLVGRETETVGQVRQTRTLRDFKIDDTGVAEFQATSFAGASGPSSTAISFSFQWPPKGGHGFFTGGTSETGRFTREAFETGSKTYHKR
jgi:hypothetical protein